eukprot:6183366-Pleurochrysis_carterae.AAC.2
MASVRSTTACTSEGRKKREEPNMHSATIGGREVDRGLGHLRGRASAAGTDEIAWCAWPRGRSQSLQGSPRATSSRRRLGRTSSAQPAATRARTQRACNTNAVSANDTKITHSSEPDEKASVHPKHKRKTAKRLEHARDGVEEVEVCAERALDAALLHLDHDVLASAQSRRVHLRDRGRGQRRRLHRRVDLHASRASRRLRNQIANRGAHPPNPPKHTSAGELANETASKRAEAHSMYPLHTHYIRRPAPIPI